MVIKDGVFKPKKSEKTEQLIQALKEYMKNNFKLPALVNTILPLLENLEEYFYLSLNIDDGYFLEKEFCGSLCFRANNDESECSFNLSSNGIISGKISYVKDILKISGVKIIWNNNNENDFHEIEEKFYDGTPFEIDFNLAEFNL